MDRAKLWPSRKYEEFMNLTPGGSAQQRYKGTGPKFVRIGSRIYYDPQDVYDFIDANKMQRTDERSGAA